MKRKVQENVFSGSANALAHEVLRTRTGGINTPSRQVHQGGCSIYIYIYLCVYIYIYIHIYIYIYICRAGVCSVCVCVNIMHCEIVSDQFCRYAVKLGVATGLGSPGHPEDCGL